MRDYEINSDLKQSKFENLKFVQFDNGSTITVNLFEDGQAVDLTNCTVVTRFKRADGRVIDKATAVTENKIIVAVDDTVTAVAGVLKVIFKITYETSKQVSTFMLLADINVGIGDETISPGSGGNVNIVITLYDDQTGEVKTVNVSSTGEVNEVTLEEVAQ